MIIPITEPLLTIKEVSAYLGVPVGTLYRWRCTRYGPPAMRIGRHLRYRPADVEKWLDAATSDNGPDAA